MQDPLQLASAYLDDQLADHQFTDLQDWLLADAENLRQFARDSFIHSRIRDVLQQEDVSGLVFDGMAGELTWVDPRNIIRLLDEEEELAAEKARALAEEQARALAAEKARLEALAAARRRFKDARQPAGVPKRVIYMVAAAAAAIVLLAVRPLVTPTPAPQPLPPVVSIEAPPVPPTPPAPPLLASITESIDARWRDAALSVSPTTRLSAGRLALESGAVELTLDNGVKLVVEAPAELELQTTERVRLDAGRVVAHVPEQALGFTLRSPVAAFVDLGTEFGVEISESGEASVQVLDGEVALVSSSDIRDGDENFGPSKTLQVGAARTVSADGSTVREIEFDEARFIRRVPTSLYELAVRQSRPLAYWRLNDQNDSTTVESIGRVRAAGTIGSGVSLQAGGVSREIDRCAVFAAGHDGIVIGRFDQFAFTSSFTLEAWALTHQGGGGPQRILSTFDRLPDESSRTGYAFGVVDGALYGFRGRSLAVHFTSHGVFDCISANDVLPNEWVHLVVAVDADGRPTMYINGNETEGMYRHFPHERWAKGDALEWPKLALPSSNPLKLGCNPPPSSPEAWQGQLSEIAIYDRVLTEKEIQRHYQAGVAK